MDSFQDLENPPAGITTAIHNRWLSLRIKETVCWEILNLWMIAPLPTLPRFCHTNFSKLELFSNRSVQKSNMSAMGTYASH